MIVGWNLVPISATNSDGGGTSSSSSGRVTPQRGVRVVGDPSPMHGNRRGSTGGGSSANSPMLVRKLHEVKLDDLLRTDKTTALQRHPGLMRHDRVLEVLYKEPESASCPGLGPDERIQYIEVR